jgi:hypothetical protein
LKIASRITCFILSLVLSISTFTIVSFGDGYKASESVLIKYYPHAITLNNLGLFQGCANEGYALEKQPTRLQGLVMFIRLLGKEDSISANAVTSFKDVPDWGKSYVAYAEQAGLSKGSGNNLFGSNDLMKSRDFATFILRGLGYSDTAGDFTYEDSLDMLNKLGSIDAEYKNYLESCTFTRGDMVKLADQALVLSMKEKSQSLIDSLGLGTVLTLQYSKIGQPENGDNHHGYRFILTDCGTLKNVKYFDITSIPFYDFQKNYVIKDFGDDAADIAETPEDVSQSSYFFLTREYDFSIYFFLYDDSKNLLGYAIMENVNSLNYDFKEIKLVVNCFEEGTLVEPENICYLKLCLKI